MHHFPFLTVHLSLSLPIKFWNQPPDLQNKLVYLCTPIESLFRASDIITLVACDVKGIYSGGGDSRFYYGIIQGSKSWGVMSRSFFRILQQLFPSAMSFILEFEVPTWRMPVQVRFHSQDECSGIPESLT